MIKQRRGKSGALVIGLFALCTLSLLHGQCSLPIDQSSPIKAEVAISLDKESVHVGDTPLITFRITNRGSVPFYIPKTIEAFDFRGGFEALVTGPPKAKYESRGGVVDPMRSIDVAKEVSESWILLWPCDFYGGTRRLATVPMSAGVFEIVGRRIPPALGTDSREKLRTTLKFPALLDAVESQPIRLRVIE